MSIACVIDEMSCWLPESLNNRSNEKDFELFSATLE